MREFAAGDIGVAAQMRARDWSVSPLGAPETWPPSLRSVVGLLLNSKFPMFVAWGPELGLLYNDAYAEILGAKHPAALGARFRDTWGEIWPEISPIIDAALRGQATFHENLPLLVHRRGFDERTWFTFSYSPVHDEAGTISGMFCACTETTAAVLAQRSNTFRLALEERLRTLSDPETIMAAAAEALGQHLSGVRVGYAEVECGADGVEWARVRREWNPQRLPGIVGQHRLTDYGITRAHAMRSGKTEVATDLAGDPQVLRDEATAYFHLGIRAQVVVPLVKGGRLVALLFAHVGTARHWTPDEIAAVEDTSERTWAAVERGRAETRLREGEERLRLALEAAGGVGTWDWDVPGERIHVDATFAAFFGITPERAAEAPPVTDFIAGMHPEDRSRVAAEIEEGLARGGDYTTEYRVIGLDGTTRWILVHGHCRHDAEGRPMRFSGVVLDISARKQIETEARESAERLRAVFDTVPVGIVLAEAPSGRITSGNAAAEQIFGHPVLPTVDVGSYGEWVAFHPDGRRVEGAEYPLARVFREGAERAEMEALYRRGDGRDAWVRFVAAPIRHADDGSVSGGLVVSLDIDRQKRAEAALRESEARFRLMADAVPQMVWITDRHGRTEFLNRQFVEYTGASNEAWTPAEMAASFMHPEDGGAVVGAFASALATGDPFEIEHRIRSAGGDYRWFLARAVPYRDPQSGEIVHWFGASVDIHDRRHAEDALRRSEARWRGLFESMREGVALCEMVYDHAGRAVDYRHQALNGAWERLTGVPIELVHGRLVSEAIPGIEPFWLETYARVVETGEAAHFEHHLDAFGRWFEVMAYRTEPGCFAAVFLDVTERKRAEEALRDSEARLRIATETNGIGIWELTLREDGTATAVTSPRHDAIFGYPEPVAEWNAEIFLSHVLPGDRELVARTLQDAVEAGRIWAFEARIRLCREGELRWIEAHGHPVVHDAGGRVARFIGIVQDITARKMAAERLQLLAREVDHRAKNALAVVQSVVQLTPAGDPAAFKRAIEGRVSALARAQTLLAEDRWRGADLRVLLEGELAPFRGESHRVVLEGAPVMLPSGAAQPLAMAAHELATNALKHGGLSVPAGSVFVAWRVEGGTPGTLRLRWAEAGGPPVAGPPTRRGFGSRVLDGTIRGQLGGRVSLKWESSGLICEMEVPLRQGAAMAATMDTDAAAEVGGWKAGR